MHYSQSMVTINWIFVIIYGKVKNNLVHNLIIKKSHFYNLQELYLTDIILRMFFKIEE